MDVQRRRDELYPLAVHVVRKLGEASASLIQRRLLIGFQRASLLVKRMRKEGILR
jgi:S-DNA-T family DNA segregation ATPase FtsK/SpoIIIE